MIYDSCSHVSVCGLSNSFPSASAVEFLLYRAVKNHIPGCSGALAGSDTLCAGTDGVTYTVPAIPNATSYTWILPSGATGASNTNSITVNFGSGALSGNITAQGVNDYGPGGSSTIWVTVNPTPPTPVIAQNGNILTSDALSGNQWHNSSGIIVGANTTTYNISSSDIYYSIVTLQGCSSDTSNVINALITGLPVPENSSNISICPNPFSSKTTLQIDNPLKNATLSVFNSYGQTVKEMKNISGSTIDLFRDDLLSGLYFFRLTENKKVIKAAKLVITD